MLTKQIPRLAHLYLDLVRAAETKLLVVMRRNWLSFIFKYFTKIIFAAVLLSLMTLNVNTLRGSQVGKITKR